MLARLFVHHSSPDGSFQRYIRHFLDKMASAIKSALPSHLSPLAGAGNGGKDSGNEQEFTSRHHGKTRSHMVSSCLFPYSPSFPISRTTSGFGQCTLQSPRGTLSPLRRVIVGLEDCVRVRLCVVSWPVAWPAAKSSSGPIRLFCIMQTDRTAAILLLTRPPGFREHFDQCRRCPDAQCAHPACRVRGGP